MGPISLGVHRPRTPKVLKNSRSFWNCQAINPLALLIGTMPLPTLNGLKKLVTEKEWEFATRGGLINKENSWRDGESLARDYTNFEET